MTKRKSRAILYTNYNNINYLNNNIDYRNDGEMYAEKLLEMFNYIPSFSDIKRERKRLEQWLYKTEDHKEKIHVLTRGNSFLKFIGIELYMETR